MCGNRVKLPLRRCHVAAYIVLSVARARSLLYFLRRAAGSFYCSRLSAFLYRDEGSSSAVLLPGSVFSFFLKVCGGGEQKVSPRSRGNFRALEAQRSF